MGKQHGDLAFDALSTHTIDRGAATPAPPFFHFEPIFGSLGSLNYLNVKSGRFGSRKRPVTL
jgi:hypothetical protein